jgi:hypothetical protein
VLLFGRSCCCVDISSEETCVCEPERLQGECIGCREVFPSLFARRVVVNSDVVACEYVFETRVERLTWFLGTVVS